MGRLLDRRRQGLISAQRFPQDFDGIVAGAPVLNFVDTVTQSLWNGQVLSETPVPLAKLKLVADAAYARCDAKDGLKDGLIDDPRRCDFDPARHVAQCPAGQVRRQKPDGRMFYGPPAPSNPCKPGEELGPNGKCMAPCPAGQTREQRPDGSFRCVATLAGAAPKPQ